MKTVTTPTDLQAATRTWRAEGLRIAFVPTMGALHDGHLALVRHAAERADRVVVSIFVNPTQFGPDEDFERYPRQPEHDAELLAGAGCDLIFLPTVETIYPPGQSTFVDVGALAESLEGKERPGHFRGVATVVAILLNLVRPDLAVFGEKDAQQLAVVRRMVRDLQLPVEIVGHPIVRDTDGVALSSRNVYLSAEQRQAARELHRALERARRAVVAGERSGDAIRALLRHSLGRQTAGQVDYAEVVAADTFHPIDTLRGRVVLPLAVRFGPTRLLDNLHLEVEENKEIS